MGPVAILVLTFTIVSYLVKTLREKIEFFLRSNWKYRFLNSLAAYIHYGDNIGIEASLKLDSPSDEVLKRRLEGQFYLSSKLSPKDVKDKDQWRGASLASSMVDCRFSLAKVCMPLLRELEFNNSGRNFIKEVRNGCPDAKTNADQSNAEEALAAGILTVRTEDNVTRPYVGNDAVHTLGVEAFYAPIQREVNRRMSIEGNNSDSMLRFCPIAMNGELERNVEMIKRLTGLDKVRAYDCADMIHRL